MVITSHKHLITRNRNWVSELVIMSKSLNGMVYLPTPFPLENSVQFMNMLFHSVPSPTFSGTLSKLIRNRSHSTIPGGQNSRQFGKSSIGVAQFKMQFVAAQDQIRRNEWDVSDYALAILTDPYKSTYRPVTLHVGIHGNYTFSPWVELGLEWIHSVGATRHISKDPREIKSRRGWIEHEFADMARVGLPLIGQ